MLALLVFSQVILGQERWTTEKAKAQALLLLETSKRDRAPKPMEYLKARALSVVERKPLLVVVGAARHDLAKDGAFIVCHVDGPWEGVTRGIVVGYDGLWMDTLPAAASLRQVHGAVSNFAVPGRVGSVAFALSASC